MISACSGSSDSSSSQQSPNASATSGGEVDPIAVDDAVNNSSGSVVGSTDDTANSTADGNAVGEPNDDTGVPATVEPDVVAVEDTNSVSETEPTAEPPNIVASDPVPMETDALVSTRINFDITVPAYQSNALQVRLQWGEKDVSAQFVVDESWSIVDDFPVDTENELFVFFNDDNGAITLGSVEQTFRTGTSESETFQITADQFDESAPSAGAVYLY